MTSERPSSPPGTGAGASAAGRSRGRPLARFVARTLLVVLAFTLTGGLLAALFVHLQVSQEDLLRWQQVSGAIRRWGLLAQCLALAAVGLWWRAIVEWGRAKGVVKPHEFEQVLRLRAGVLAFGFAYLLLVPIGPTTLWRYLFQ